MVSFEEALQLFGTTIYGSEMKDSLLKCFGELYNLVKSDTQKIEDIEKKIKLLEDEKRGDQDG